MCCVGQEGFGFKVGAGKFSCGGAERAEQARQTKLASVPRLGHSWVNVLLPPQVNFLFPAPRSPRLRVTFPRSDAD